MPSGRVDLLLKAPDRPPCWLESKSGHFKRSGTLAEIPDCVAARSLKHLGELKAMAAEGHRAVTLLVIQSTDCDQFAACADLNRKYATRIPAMRANTCGRGDCLSDHSRRS